LRKTEFLNIINVLIFSPVQSILQVKVGKRFKKNEIMNIESLFDSHSINLKRLGRAAVLFLILTGGVWLAAAHSAGENFLSLPPGVTITDTTAADFQTGTATNVDLTSSPDNIVLSRPSTLDQQQTVASTSGTGFNTTQWLGQTFVPGVTGNLAKIEMALFCASCSGTDQPITVEIRTTTGSPALPTSTVLATTTIPGFNSGASATFTATFATPPALTAGTTYAYTLRLATNRTGTYAAVFGNAPTDYLNGNRVVSTNSGGTWTVPTSTGIARDLVFRTYMDNGFTASGDFISGLKDANPGSSQTVTWDSLSWNISTPANTAIVFQIAASNNAAGPFNFVGPDGTSATFYTNSGAGLLGAFDNNRYLKYKAYFSTTDPAQTPVLNDVTIVYSTLGPTAANVSVSGRVTSSSGRGLARAAVILTDANGSVRSAMTNDFGYFRFSEVGAGQTYIVSVRAKGYIIEPQVISLSDEMTDLNFIANR
jgi:hypothetical protein